MAERLAILEEILEKYFLFFASLDSIYKLIVILRGEAKREYLFPTLLTHFPIGAIPESITQVELVGSPLFSRSDSIAAKQVKLVGLA